MESDENKLLSTLDIANELELSPYVIRQYIKRGELEGQKVGNRYLVSEADLKRFIKRGQDGGNNG